MSATLDVLMVEPGQYPKMEQIGSDLASLQAAVGGFIQVVYPFDDPVALVCDDEGKLKRKTLNRALRDEDGKPCDIIAGKFFICGLGEETFESLPKELQEKYEKKFHQPEAFLKLGRQIAVIPVEPTKSSAKKDFPSRGPEL